MSTQYSPQDFTHDAIGHGCYAVDLDGEVHSFIDDIRDALIARGVLYCDADRIWRIKWHGFDLRREQAAYLAVCDFCSARPVTWTVPCATFAMPTIQMGDRVTPPCTSMGDWAACESCGTLIAENHRSQFLFRCLQMHKGEPREIRHAQRELHRRFWRHYQGGASRIPPRPFGH